MNRFIKFSLILFILWLAGCQTQPTLFKKLSSNKTGIQFANRLDEQGDSATARLNILEYLYYYNGGGVATGDLNNDGLLDLYFVSSQGKNALYLNKGKRGGESLQFEDVTDKAGVGGMASWQTGVSMADVNGDGLLDIYVCGVGKYKSLKGHNELYINQGAGKDGVPVFEEKANEYGLAFEGFSTQATFFDYDRDGDLDCYLLTHATHSVSSYDKVSARGLRDNEAGDHLYQNRSEERGVRSEEPSGSFSRDSNSSLLFEDVSIEAGIYGAAMGYGLGVVTADVNNDGWDDIYVSNDFHEDDYYYVNQRDGTFKEEVKSHFKHLSKYSMGCDVADVNNDGRLDVFTSDMHPPDEVTEKMSLGEDAYDIYQYKLQFGFYNQYSRNALQLNIGHDRFVDAGLLAGVSSTDWTWSPLLADFDNDGIRDVFISNGIPHRPNDLDYLKFLSAEVDTMITKLQPVFAQKASDQKAIDEMPDGAVANFMFRGTGTSGRPNLRYEDQSKAWGFTEKTVSNGAIYADLDNDGDLDIVTNDLNSPAGVYENTLSDNRSPSNYLTIKLMGNKPNTQGVGAKVVIKQRDSVQVMHQQPVRGFMSSVSPWLHAGLGNNATVDTLVVIWPDGKMQQLVNVNANQTLTLKQTDARLDGSRYAIGPPASPLFVEDSTRLQLTHRENDFAEFTREPLMPFKVSTDGPKLAVGDVNGDGLDDVYLCGARDQAGQLMIQTGAGKFASSHQPDFMADAAHEDTDALFFDADGDRDLDLYVVSGGNEYVRDMTELQDRLYRNDGKERGGHPHFVRDKMALPQMDENKGCVSAADFDADGDLDLFVGGRSVAFGYGDIPRSFLLRNNGKGGGGLPQFADQTKQLAPDLQLPGLVTDALWTDLDNDNDPDLVVVGEWMGIRMFENTGKGVLKPMADDLTNRKGLWHSIAAADMDNDGDMDLVAGNLGQNTKYIKQSSPLLRMYANDLDQNGRMEQLLTYQRDGNWYPVASRDELAKMAPIIINKRFTKYNQYAGKTMEDLFKENELGTARLFEVNTFASVYLENTGDQNTGTGQFAVHDLPQEAQFAPIFALSLIDADGDGQRDILCGGNLYGVSTYQGQYDASYGWFLKGNPKAKSGEGKFRTVWPAQSGWLADGELRDIQPISVGKQNAILVARNNKTVQLFTLKM